MVGRKKEGNCERQEEREKEVRGRSGNFMGRGVYRARG